METFVLLPFFLLSRVPSDADTWRYGPEYTFTVNSNASTLEGHSVSCFKLVYSTLKCRPRDFDTLRCQFTTWSEIYEGKDGWFNAPFDITFVRQGIQSLVVPRDIDLWLLDMVRTFISQMNFGVELLHKPDGAFNAEEKSYLGQCESLVNVSREAHEHNEVSKEKDYEIVPMAGLQKKRGEMLVIEKTRNLENCVDKRPYMMSGDNTCIETGMVNKSRNSLTDLLSSRSQVEISDTGFNSYTENMVDITKEGITSSFHEKIGLRLYSVLPAKEALQPFSVATMSVSPYALSEKEEQEFFMKKRERE